MNPAYRAPHGDDWESGAKTQSRGKLRACCANAASGRVRMRGELKRLQRELKITFVHVTHAQDEAMAIADYMVVMRQDLPDQLTIRGVRAPDQRLRVGRSVRWVHTGLTRFGSYGWKRYSH